MVLNSIHTCDTSKSFSKSYQKVIHGVVYTLMSLYHASEHAYIHFQTSVNVDSVCRIWIH